MAGAIRALTPMVLSPLRTNAISAVPYATMMALIVGKDNPCVFTFLSFCFELK